ncbi:24279_t:CDS:2 [Dentiscutata erythropus]|uniref:24279_t:CDS:1 n=1 Tax=Dentiscutata erythropus TaxID=1348616 RepID=A0A9N9J3L1_9GLOM|nr:24279_t:CDS:2 [Dentiscutata erythropus]
MSQDNSTSSNRFSTLFTSTLLHSHQYNGTPPPPYKSVSPSTQLPSYNGDTNVPEDDDRVIINESQNTNEPTLTSKSEPALSVSLSSTYKIVPNTESQEMICMASLVTSDYIPEEAKETGSHADIVLILDVSSSMSGSKINLLKESLNFIVSELSPKDRLSLVTFNTYAKRITPLLYVNEENKSKLYQAIRNLRANGGTNIGNGLKLGLDILTQRTTKNPITGMILLSDGMDNKEQSYEHLYERAREAEISIHTFGYGSDHDSRKLHTVSVKTEGSFTYIYEFEQIKQCFAGCIGGLVSISCCDVKLFLRIPETIKNVKISEVLSKYDNTISDNMLSAQINIHNLYAGEKKDLLFLVKMLPTETDDDSESNELKIIDADVNYFDIHKGIRINCLESPATLKIIHTTSEIDPSDNPINSQVIQQKYRYLTSKVILDASNFAENGNYARAQLIINNLKQEIQLHRNESPEFYDILIEDLSMIARQQSNANTYQSGGRAHSLQQTSAHHNQRSWGSRTRSEAAYQSPTVQRYSSRSVNLE